MSDVIDYKIHGNDMQIVEIELDPGEGVRAEAGAMMFMEGGIEMETAAGGGMMGGTLWRRGPVPRHPHRPGKGVPAGASPVATGRPHYIGLRRRR